MITRRIPLAAIALFAVGLGACGGSDSSSDTVAVTSTVLLDTTTAASTTLPATTVVPTTAAPTTAAPVTAPPTTLPPATNPPTTGPGLYELVTPPTVPTGRTDPFELSGTLGDGQFWVVYNGGETATPDITVLQAFFGDECTMQAEADGDECLNDIYIRGNPSRDIDDLPFAADALLSVANANGPGTSYAITPDELVTVRAGSPSAEAPDSFYYSSFPWLMTVQGGQIVKFEQVWTP